MKFLWMVVLLWPASLLAQQNEKETKTEINEVTVYLDGAQVSREGKISLSDGKTLLVMKGLSPHIDEKSIQVKGEGDFTILGVKHGQNFLNKADKDARVAALEAREEELTVAMDEEKSRLSVLDEKRSVLNNNKTLGEDRTVQQLQEAIEFYDKALTEINEEVLDINRRVNKLKEERQDVRDQWMQIANKNDTPTGEIRVEVDSNQPVQGKIKVTYVVDNARWFPGYDIRVATIDQPVNVAYRAEIIQNTGEDWENVRLKLSNGNPRQSGSAPEFQPWYLNRPYYQPLRMEYREGEVAGIVSDTEGTPLPGVNVVLKGSTVGTVTDIDGRYSIARPPSGEGTLIFSYVGFSSVEQPILNSQLNVIMAEDIHLLEEVVSVGYASRGRASGVTITDGIAQYDDESDRRNESSFMSSNTLINQTTVEFEVDRPYTVRSNRESTRVDLKNYQIEALYEYYAAPKLETDAFLMAHIPNWDQYNFLEGEANLFFEGTYVGRTILTTNAMEDTLSLSLGRDKSIVISREKVDDFTAKKTLGSNKVESRGFKLVIRNQKQQAINLKLLDQLPVSTQSDIVVKPAETSFGNVNTDTGEIEWNAVIDPGKQHEIRFAYEVKYPKRMNLWLE